VAVIMERCSMACERGSMHIEACTSRGEGP
jgi:hypothetical protein